MWLCVLRLPPGYICRLLAGLCVLWGFDVALTVACPLALVPYIRKKKGLQKVWLKPVMHLSVSKQAPR